MTGLAFWVLTGLGTARFINLHNSDCIGLLMERSQNPTKLKRGFCGWYLILNGHIVDHANANTNSGDEMK